MADTKMAGRKSIAATAASAVVGDDIATGDFVTPLREVIELPSFLWDVPTPNADEFVRLRPLAEDAGIPFKVTAVCLPFVYAKSHTGSVVIFNLHKHQLLKLNFLCARRIWEKLKAHFEN